MKRMILAFVLVTFSSCVVHAQDSSSKGNTHVRAKKKDEVKKEKKDDVTYLDMSGPDEKEDSMPAITPKGKL